MVCGSVTMYLTVNTGTDGKPLEIFAKSDEGWQGWLDALCVTASLALQYGCPLETLLAKWRGMRFSPDGIAGQGTSLPDTIAKKLLPEVNHE